MVVAMCFLMVVGGVGGCAEQRMTTHISRSEAVPEMNEYLQMHQERISSVLSAFFADLNPEELGKDFPLEFSVKGVKFKFFLTGLDNREKIEMIIDEISLVSSDIGGELSFEGKLRSLEKLKFTFKGEVEVPPSGFIRLFHGKSICKLSFFSDRMSGSARAWFAMTRSALGGLFTDGEVDEMDLSLPLIEEFNLSCDQGPVVSRTLLNLGSNSIGRAAALFVRKIPLTLQERLRRTLTKEAKSLINRNLMDYAPVVFMEGFNAFNKWLHNDQLEKAGWVPV